MEVIEIYSNCPGKERLYKIDKEIDDIHRRIDKKESETKEEIRMIEKSIKSLSDTMNKNNKDVLGAIQKVANKGTSGVQKVLVWLVVVLFTVCGSLITYTFFTNIGG